MNHSHTSCPGHQREELNPSLSSSPPQEAAKSTEAAGPQPPFLQTTQAQNLASTFFVVWGLSGVVWFGLRLGREGGRVGGPGERGRDAGRAGGGISIISVTGGRAGGGISIIAAVAGGQESRSRGCRWERGSVPGGEQGEPGWGGGRCRGLRSGGSIPCRAAVAAEPCPEQAFAIAPARHPEGEQPLLQSPSTGAWLLPALSPLFLLLQQTLKYRRSIISPLCMWKPVMLLKS